MCEFALQERYGRHGRVCHHGQAAGNEELVPGVVENGASSFLCKYIHRANGTRVAEDGSSVS